MILLMLLATTPSQAQKVKFCFLFCAVEEVPVIDSFCQSYQRVIRNRADSATVKAVPDPVRKRTEANDALYRCACEGWKNPLCAGLDRAR